eukprot:CAMPEP_0113612640 /NCGR_PEP_ID=MMETSP0017_2-20120614/6208_1 /TAXON_ID=2856 /ORGANISM="Cylindrotheca closterium" /LENGTH=328 /DNA_ID=CAMNT_0000521689 /DNA_START=68 /DNA_END=1051 /DNA_ORIENTATION=- /assembly_acc=CAM_ASM_000147
MTSSGNQLAPSKIVLLAAIVLVSTLRIVGNRRIILPSYIYDAVDFRPTSVDPVDENRPGADGFAHSASVCTIQKGGLRYIDEWVVYYLAIGFEKIYIYDNSIENELEPWYNTLSQKIKDRIVVRHFPAFRAQRPAYTLCWEDIRNRKAHSWIAFFDMDEFLVIKNRTKYPQVLDLLDDLPADQGGLAINWVMFGFNGQTKYEPKPVTLRFQRRDPKSTNSLVKTIVRAQVTPNVRSAHFVKYNASQPMRTKDTRGNIIEKAYNEDRVDEVVGLYHFFTYSFDEFKERCSRGDVAKKKSQWNMVQACKDNETIKKELWYDETLYDPAPW